MQTLRKAHRVHGRAWRVPWTDASLTALLITQCVITFVAIPIAAVYPAGHLLMDVGHLTFAALCAIALTNRRAVRAALLGALVVFGFGPAGIDSIGARLGLGPAISHNVIAVVAFGFNLLVTLLVAGRAFGPGQVTAHRVQGAVLVYLNVAALFAIAFNVIETLAPGSIIATGGGLMSRRPGALIAELSYFSLATITTSGYGDFIPLHQLARSLANLEAVFGQLFPPIFVARLVALHLVHSRGAKANN